MRPRPNSRTTGLCVDACINQISAAKERTQPGPARTEHPEKALAHRTVKSPRDPPGSNWSDGLHWGGVLKTYMRCSLHT